MDSHPHFLTKVTAQKITMETFKPLGTVIENILKILKIKSTTLKAIETFVNKV